MEQAIQRQSAKPRWRPRRLTARKLVVWSTAFVGTVLVLIAALGVVGATAGTHTLGSVFYGQIPPTIGDHSPVWQHCGFYSEPIGTEHAVHSLEHGAIWITYAPDLSAPEIVVLRNLAATQEEVIVSPFAGLPAPVVVSAWNQQVRLDIADDAQLVQAIGNLRANQQAPEPEATCDGPNLWLTGGTGNPEP